MARNDSANEIAVLIMFDQDLLCLFKFRGSRSTLAASLPSRLDSSCVRFLPEGFEDCTEGTERIPVLPSSRAIYNGLFEPMVRRAIVASSGTHEHLWHQRLSAVAVEDCRSRHSFMVEVHSAGKNGKADGDIYMVGSKTIPVKNASPFAAFILSGGVRRTNAEL